MKYDQFKHFILCKIHQMLYQTIATQYGCQQELQYTNSNEHIQTANHPRPVSSRIWGQ